MPVVTGATKEAIIDASLNSSYLWSDFTIFHLTENMRLSKTGLNNEEKEKIASFAKWILEIGDGLKCDINDDIDEDASCRDSVKITYKYIYKSNSFNFCCNLSEFLYKI